MAQNFQETLEEQFPRSVRSHVYLDRVMAVLQDHDFTTERTLPLVSICRDELTTRFFDEIEQRWGLAFTLAGLGGVPALGRTGWSAAFSHIPNDRSGRGSVVVFGFPHIGIEVDGSIGVTLRRNQTGPTATCGALASIFEKARTEQLPTTIDFDDYEATRLAIRLIDPATPPNSLADLTIAALEAIEVDIWKALDEAEVWRHHDVAVWCGVQIHGHGDDDWIWPRDAWFTGGDGQRRRFPTDQLAD